MPKKKPEPITTCGPSSERRQEGWQAIAGPAGQTYTITVTERGLRIELGEGWRIVYTSLITDNVRNLRFEVEPAREKGSR